MQFGVVTGCPNLTGDSCKIPFLAVNDSVTVDIEVFAFAAGTLTVRASSTAPQHDPDSSNNVGVATTVVAPAAVTFTVTNTNATGPGSLRQAILDSNTNVGAPTPNHINFNITSGTPPYVIALQSALGENLIPVTVPVVIDGTTQPGFAG